MYTERKAKVASFAKGRLLHLLKIGQPLVYNFV